MDKNASRAQPEAATTTTTGFRLPRVRLPKKKESQAPYYSLMRNAGTKFVRGDDAPNGATCQLKEYNGQLYQRDHDLLKRKHICVASSPVSPEDLRKFVEQQQAATQQAGDVEWIAQLGSLVVFDIDNPDEIESLANLERRMNGDEAAFSSKGSKKTAYGGCRMGRLKSTFVSANFCDDFHPIQKSSEHLTALAQALQENLPGCVKEDDTMTQKFVFKSKGHSKGESMVDVPLEGEIEDAQLVDGEYPHHHKDDIKANWILLSPDTFTLRLRAIHRIVGGQSLPVSTVSNGEITNKGLDISYSRRQRTIRLRWKEVMILVTMHFDEHGDSIIEIPVRFLIELSWLGRGDRSSNTEVANTTHELFSFANDARDVSSIAASLVHDKASVIHFDHRLLFCPFEKGGEQDAKSCPLSKCRFHHVRTMCMADILGKSCCNGACNYVHGFTQLWVALSGCVPPIEVTRLAVPQKLKDTFDERYQLLVRETYGKYLNYLFRLQNSTVEDMMTTTCSKTDVYVQASRDFRLTDEVAPLRLFCDNMTRRCKVANDVVAHCQVLNNCRVEKTNGNPRRAIVDTRCPNPDTQECAVALQLAVELCSKDRNSEKPRAATKRGAFSKVAEALKSIFRNHLCGENGHWIVRFNHCQSRMWLAVELNGETALHRSAEFMQAFQLLCDGDKHQRYSLEHVYKRREAFGKEWPRPSAHPDVTYVRYSSSSGVKILESRSHKMNAVHPDYAPQPTTAVVIPRETHSALMEAICGADPASEHVFEAFAGRSFTGQDLEAAARHMMVALKKPDEDINEAMDKLKRKVIGGMSFSEDMMPAGRAAEYAVWLYTSDYIYCALNKILRQPLDDSLFRCLNTFMGILLCGIADRTVNEQEATKKILFRGIGLNEDQLRQYTVGTTVMWTSLTSCTANEETARKFASASGPFLRPILLEIEVFRYADISDCSAHNNEKEILLPPLTRVRVVRVIEDRICLQQLVYRSGSTASGRE